MHRVRIDGVVLLGMVMGLALAPGVIAQDTSLVGWWKLDETSGTVAADSSGNNHPGVLHGSPRWVSGKFGGGLQLDGTVDYVDTGYTQNLTRWTVCAWVTSPAAPANTFPSGPVHRENNYQFNWNHNVDSFRGSTALMVAGAWTPASFATLEANRWYYLTGIYDGSSLKAFVNGDLITSVSLTGTPNAENNSLKFGRSATAAQFFAGTLDDVRVYDRALSQAEIQLAMLGEGPGLPRDPDPMDRAVDVPRDAVLKWTPGKYAKTHDVYFGTSFDDVDSAGRGGANGVTVADNQEAAAYDPAGLLTFGQTYYWRVDEVNAAPDSSTYKGSTWSFTAETYGFPVTPVKATASSSINALSGPERTIDGSGLGLDDSHSILSTDMWLSKKGISPIWIQYEFDQPYKLYQVWVWNSNQSVEPDLGFGAKEVTVETSLDGATWTALAGVAEFSQASGDPNYVHSTTVDFGGVLCRYVKLTIATNWSDGAKQAGLSEVRFFYVPVRAFGPVPAPGTVATVSSLNWRPGREAAGHQVAFGGDPDAVLNGTAPVNTVIDHTLSLSSMGLEYGKTYYWKVNEVNDKATPSSWAGDVWNFSLPDFSVVDDFEKYNDVCGRIYFAWVDGLGHNGAADCGVSPSPGNGSGATVGNPTPPYAERTIVHGGRQSMPLAYDNTLGKGTSEATRTFETAQDWTQGGAKTLVVFFRGDMGNGPGQLYAVVNGTRLDYAGGTASVTSPIWKQWNIDLAPVGAGLKAVKTLTLGVSGSGKGVLTIDDIRLYRLAPSTVQPVDPGTNGLSAYYKMEGDVKDSSGKGNHGTAMANPAYVQGPSGYGMALRFEGMDDYVDLPIGSLISTLTSSTFATWVNFTNTGGGWQRIFDFGSGTTSYLFLTPRQSTDGAMRFAITTAGSAGESTLTAPATLPTGWHHVAVVIDGPTRVVQLYLDGSGVASGPTATLPSALGKPTQNWLGRSQYAADAYFSGILDEFRIYSRALSTGEVRFLAGDR